MPAIQKLRAFRRRAGLRQEKLDAMLGVKPGTVANWERGRRKPNSAARKLFHELERRDL